MKFLSSLGGAFFSKVAISSGVTPWNMDTVVLLRDNIVADCYRWLSATGDCWLQVADGY